MNIRDRVKKILSSLHWMDTESIEMGNKNGDELMKDYNKSFDEATHAILDLMEQTCNEVIGERKQTLSKTERDAKQYSHTDKEGSAVYTPFDKVITVDSWADGQNELISAQRKRLKQLMGGK